MPEIVTVGEALIDLTQTAEDSAHIRHYAAFPGGAPANVAVAAARLGRTPLARPSVRLSAAIMWMCPGYTGPTAFSPRWQWSA